MKTRIAGRLDHWTVSARLVDAMRIWFRPRPFGLRTAFTERMRRRSRPRVSN